VCTLMAALPGLPMVGHGQIEGFREKYGMEYRKAYLDERADDELVGRHERQIFPLLRRRALFSGVKDFLLYDFFLSSGAVDENVIAFSNRHEGERCLVVVHNRFADTAGWVRVSAAYAGEERAGGPRSLQRQDLGQGLGLRNEPGWFVVFRDAVSGLEYIRPASELCANGMFIELHAYQTHVFLDFREMADDAGAHLARLSAYLQGRGVGSMEEAGREMSLQPLHNAWRELCRTDLLQRQLAVLHDRTGSKGEGALWLELEEKIGDLFCRAGGNALATGGSQKIIELLLEDLLVLWTVLCPERGHAQMGADGMPTAKNILQMQFKAKAELERLFLLWLYAQRLTETGSERRADGRSLFAEWLLDGVLVESLRGWGFSESRVDPALRMIRSACGLRTEIRACSTELAKTGGSVAAALGQLVKTMARDDDVQALLQLHRFQNDLFFNRENFHWFCDWLTVQILWEFHRSAKKEAEDRRQPIAEIMEFFNFLPALAAKTGFKLEIFLEKLDQLAAGKE
ncbi:MAG: hypothetical protein PHX05_06635, partial [Acidobacteriota bacterium]|nr:hypothetical protein [Acidobacteriota bacterium]